MGGDCREAFVTSSLACASDKLLIYKLYGEQQVLIMYYSFVVYEKCSSLALAYFRLMFTVVGLVSQTHMITDVIILY